MEGYELDVPIYGLATGYHKSAIALFRISGKGCIELFSKCFSNAGKLSSCPSGMAVHGFLNKNGKRLDEVMVIKYSGGHGYTGEEAVEVMTHGSLVIIRSFSALLETLSFRQALPGEFTYRAFMHGKMDLLEAEAVEELISSRGEVSASSALSRLTGSLSSEISRIKNELLDILSSLEVYLDYAEDEIIDEWVYPDEEIKDIAERIERIIGTYKTSRIYQDGVTVVLAGPTNAGKSSLFNAILKEERAIVSDEEGTTRDYIEADISINGLPVRLFDTAGLRESAGTIEKEGIRRTRALLDEADLILYLSDDGTKDERLEGKDNVIVVYPKSDLHKRKGLSFSSLTNEGIPELLAAIASYFKSEEDMDDDVVPISSEREKGDLERTLSTLRSSLENSDSPLDIQAIYFRDALSSLSRLTGEVTSDDVLENLFSKFCLGK